MKFKSNEKHTSEENAYILYMMIGSYFHRCYCKNPILEKKLFLYYKEMNEGTQIARESRVINDMNRVLSDYKIDFTNINCEAHIRKIADEYLLLFYTGFEVVVAEVNKNGNYSIRIIKKSEVQKGL